MSRKSRKILKDMENNSSKMLWKTGIYVRLSVEDIRKKESHSVEVQKQYLLQYIYRSKEMELIDIYEDVNCSGTNFHRPAFQKMLKDIEKNKINCIVVKDLSRIGRNYIETGEYLEYIFPANGVRVIALNDNYDSEIPSCRDSVLLPLKNMINQAYAKDISKKMCSQYEIKRKRGEFCGNFAPYGYWKVGNRLIVDVETAPIVEMIFSMALTGMGKYAIANHLNQEKILPPGRYRYEKGIVESERFAKQNKWHPSTIERILKNPMYIGDMVQGKYLSSFLQQKGRKYIEKQNWIVVKQAHEPIISTDVFHEVQERRLRHECS